MRQRPGLLGGATREDAHGLRAEHAAFWTLQRRRRELLDDDSLVELGSSRRHRSDAFGLDRKRPDGDGVVAGAGTVAERPVVVYAQDGTVLGGSLGAANVGAFSPNAAGGGHGFRASERDDCVHIAGQANHDKGRGKNQRPMAAGAKATQPTKAEGVAAGAAATQPTTTWRAAARKLTNPTDAKREAGAKSNQTSPR